MRINSDKCVEYGYCIKSCAYGVLEIIDNVKYVCAGGTKNCKGRNDCSEECETEAMRIIHM